MANKTISKQKKNNKKQTKQKAKTKLEHYKTHSNTGDKWKTVSCL